MKKTLLLTLLLVFTVCTSSIAQFGIERAVRKKYQKKGMEHAEKEKKKGEDKAYEEAQKGMDAGEAKGMEEAEKGLDKAQPGLEKAQEGAEKGEESVIMGLTKYQEFVDGYDEEVASKDPEDYKKYPFESAIVEFKIEGSDKGFKTVYVDNGGFKVAEHKTIQLSKKKQHKTAEILYGADIITLDYEDNQAVKMHNPLAFYLADPERDWQKTGEKIIIKMGYEIVGKETILGKECNIWKQGRNKIWIWDGITLKAEYGKNIETATNIEIDVDVPMDKFEIPEGFEVEVVDLKEALPQITDEEINEISGTMQEDDEMLDMVEKMTYPEFKAMVLKEDPEKDEEEIRQAYLYIRQKAKMRDKK